MTRVVAIGLDGMEIRHAERLMDEGRMPALAALRARGETARLDHGPAGRTGLAWEHFASGLDPEAAERASAVEFDPATYEVWQEGARYRPVWEDLGIRTVVFDPPYVDLDLAPHTAGVVGWGAHDPGTPLQARPAKLVGEVPAYPAGPWTYALPWSSAEECRAMGEGLVEGLRIRTRAACSLMAAESDWDLFVVVAGEPHSAVEALWHGVDPSHPAASHPSAPEARAALDAVYEALDEMVAAVVGAAGADATVVAFSMGGMGRNESDVASMFLLGELLHRAATGESLAVSPHEWASTPQHELTLASGGQWTDAVARCFPPAPGVTGPEAWARRAARLLPPPVRQVLASAVIRRKERTLKSWPSRSRTALGLDWMPVARYRPWWPTMRAFAIPSFYDGRVRLNVVGRERDGVVAPGDYEAVADEIERLIRDCRDLHTGEPVVAEVERPHRSDPLRVRSDEADLVVVWRGCSTGFRHPELGTIGPVPLRRTGGHTGPYGTLVVAGPGVDHGDRGVRSSFEVVDVVRALLAGRSASA